MPAADFDNYHKRLSRAAGETETEVTDAQREAGNYKAGTLHFHGLTVKIENPLGSVRRGVGKDGKRWQRVMRAHYGRIKRTVGMDGEPVDVFIGSHPSSQLAFVISQLTDDGDLDEHKCVLGVRNGKEARELYLAHYPDGWADDRMGEVRGMFMPQFKAWLKTDNPVKARRKAAFTEDFSVLTVLLKGT